MFTSVLFNPLFIKFLDYRTLIISICFVAGNIVLPQLCHIVPNGGIMFLPIYFFTLIAAYKFGIHIGLLTALFSPLVSHLLFEMPATHVLPMMLVKSCLLAAIASFVAAKTQKISLQHIVVIVLSYPVLGGVIEFIFTGGLAASIQVFTIGYPGLFIQLFAGWWILRKLADFK